MATDRRCARHEVGYSPRVLLDKDVMNQRRAASHAQEEFCGCRWVLVVMMMFIVRVGVGVAVNMKVVMAAVKMCVCVSRLVEVDSYWRE